MATGNLFQGFVYFNSNGQGWSEKYHFANSTRDTAKSKLNEIVRRRLFLTPPDVEVVYARVSLYDTPRDSKAVVGNVGPGLANTTAYGANLTSVDYHETALRVRLETANGQFAIREFSGLPDTEVESDLLVSAIAPLHTGDIAPIPAPGASVSYAEEWASFLEYLMENTSYVKADAVPGGTYTPDVWTDAIVLAITSRRRGRPFGMRAGRRLG